MGGSLGAQGQPGLLSEIQSQKQNKTSKKKKPTIQINKQKTQQQNLQNESETHLLLAYPTPTPGDCKSRSFRWNWACGLWGALVAVTHLVPRRRVRRPMNTERISLPKDAALTGSSLCS